MSRRKPSSLFHLGLTVFIKHLLEVWIIQNQQEKETFGPEKNGICRTLTMIVGLARPALSGHRPVTLRGTTAYWTHGYFKLILCYVLQGKLKCSYC
jgi:hypothetical protein